MKKAVSFIAAAATILCASAAIADGPKVFYDGEQMSFEVEPYITEEGRTMVPFRDIFEKAGAQVVWDESTRTVIAVKADDEGSTSITLQIGNTDAFVNEEKKTLDKAAEITGNRTFVPLRFVMESLGANVEWDAENCSVIITAQE